jgi:hypothetical protein
LATVTSQDEFFLVTAEKLTTKDDHNGIRFDRRKHTDMAATVQDDANQMQGGQ